MSTNTIWTRADLERLELNAGMFGFGAITASWDEDVQALFVQLDERSEERAVVLHTWAQSMQVVDMVAGQYSKTDPLLRLHLRGRWSTSRNAMPLLPAGQVLVVTAAWPVESPEAAEITAGVAGDPDLLVRRLMTLAERPQL